MEPKQLLTELRNRNCYSIKRLAAMLGISTNRLAELLAGYDPTNEEKHKIEVLKKFAMFSERGVNFEDEIAFQINQVGLLENCLDAILERSHLDPDTEQAIKACVECSKAESMYLGMFYANANKEELVYQVIRKTRKITGTEDVK